MSACDEVDAEALREAVVAELLAEVGRNRVRDDVDAFDDGETIADFAHDDGDGGVERIRDRREDLGGGLFLAALHLAEIAQGDTRLAGHLPEGSSLLQTE